MHCKNCKYWDGEFCGAVEISDQNPLTLFEIEVKVNDDWGLSEYLRTGPEFGCLKFERATNEDS